MAGPNIIPAPLPGQAQDYRLQYAYLKEWCSIRLPKIPYYRHTTNISASDELHFEELDQEKTWSNRIYVHGHIEPENTEQNQEMKGQDFMEYFMLYISLPSLVNSEDIDGNPAPLAEVDSNLRLEDNKLYIQNGDRYWYCGHEYEIININDDAPWGPDGFAMLWFELRSKVVRPQTVGSTGYDFYPDGAT